MSRRSVPAIIFAFSLLLIVYVGCSTKTVVPPPPTPQPSIVSSPQSKTMTDAFPMGAPTALPIPAIGGFSGSFSMAANNAPAGATVTLTSYLKPPPGVPAVQSVIRIPMKAQSQAHALTAVGDAIFWVSHKYSAAIDFQGFPVTTWRVPASFTSGSLALETFDGTSGTLMDTEFDTSITGNIATFPGSSASFAVVSGDTYWWELITGKPTPGPSPSPSPSPLPLQITSGSPPNGNVGIPYGNYNSYCVCFCKRSGCRIHWTGFGISTSGGTPPFTWSWSAGAGSSLPPGLILKPEPNFEGIIGTPTAVGTYTFSVSVRDAGSPAQHVKATYTVTISPPPTPSPSPSPSPSPTST
jgi:hypothetical protein